jgi:hypothetical protein
MDFGRGISYIRQDPNWLVKTLLGSVIALVPVLNFAAYGYGLEVLKNVFNGRETPLPEWGDNFGDKFVRGLLAFIIQFVYALPMLLLMCVGWFGIVAGMAVSEGRADSGGGIAMLCLMPLLLIGALFAVVLGMVAQARYAITNDVGEAFRVGDVWRTFRNGLGRWLGVVLMMIPVFIVMYLAIALTCGFGILLSFYVSLIQYHWMAQAYRLAIGDVQQPLSASY